MTEEKKHFVNNFKGIYSLGKRNLINMKQQTQAMEKKTKCNKNNQKYK